MAITPTPTWAGAQSGLIGNAGATAASAQINQLLGSHTAGIIYPGTAVVSPFTNYVSPLTWNGPLLGQDIDQPFTMSGTAISRVQIPVLPTGNGADLLVSLCADNAGVPGTMIVQTRVPASWINQLSAVAGVDAASTPGHPFVQYTGNALAVAPFIAFLGGNESVTPYPYPSTVGTGVAANASTTWYSSGGGGSIYQIGGVSGGAALANVFAIPYDATAALGPSVPQPAFPTTNDGSSASCVVSDASTGQPIIVNTGGGVTDFGPAVATVYTSSIDSSGNLSSWSGQTALPYNVQSHTMCSFNGYVYSIGGKNSGGTLASVSYAQVSNGQITAWNAGPPLPQATQLAYTAVSNGLLFVIGGTTSALTPFFANVWYAAINANGTLGPWQAGPPLPNPTINTIDLNSNPLGYPWGIIANQCSLSAGTAGASALPVTASGPGSAWSSMAVGSAPYPGYSDLGNGTLYAGALASSTALSYSVSLAPYISVPLPASGLTNGGTYHLLLQQQGGSVAGYLTTCAGADALGTSGPTVLASAADAYAWSAGGPAHLGVPITVWTNPAAPTPGQLPLHTWEDSGARITTNVQATTPDQRLLGVLEATCMNLPLNANTGFETGTAPWTVSGGSFAQSTAQSLPGALHSCRITPNGSSAQVFIQCENLPCLPGQSVTVSAYLWFTSAVTNQASVSVNWYTAAGAYISTSSNNVSVPASTWTVLSNTFTAPSTPSLAYQFAVDPTLGGTPAAAQVFYVAGATGYATYTGAQQSSVAEVGYAAGTTFPPVSLTKLA
jgi:Carbohydrate binding domain